MRFAASLPLAALLLVSTLSPAETSTEERPQFTPYSVEQFPKYAELPGWAKRTWTAQQYEAFVHDPEVELVSVRYLSDQYHVNGFIYRPRKNRTMLPLIIWNHGGVGTDTAIGNSNFHDFYEMYRLAKAGFVVAASQFRGIGGSEGKDEVGGADLHDITALIHALSSEPYIDANRLFMFGFSRGAMMTLQSVASGVDVKAAVVVGSPTDWEELIKTNPRLEQLAKDGWPGFKEQRSEAIRSRSAVQWAEKLDRPILFFVGAADEAIPPAQSMKLAGRLSDLGLVYELVVYANDDHFVTRNREARLQRTVDWFTHPPARSIGHYLARYMRAHSSDDATSEYWRLHNSKEASSIDFSEPELNNLGYNLLFNGRVQDAITVFLLNCKAYPRSDNALESLGEGYVAAKQFQLAEGAFKRSLSLNPHNREAAQQLADLSKKEGH